VHVVALDLSSDALKTAGLDPTPLAAFRGAKRHPHQIGDRRGALAQVEKSVADLDAAFREMTCGGDVVIPIALTAGSMICGKTR
jgi:hypothetical protein